MYKQNTSTNDVRCAFKENKNEKNKAEMIKHIDSRQNQNKLILVYGSEGNNPFMQPDWTAIIGSKFCVERRILRL